MRKKPLIDDIKECESIRLIFPTENVYLSSYEKEKIYNALLEADKKDLIIHLLEKRVDELEKYIKGHQPFIQLEIYDKDNDTKHIIGTNPHDCLYVKNGQVRYYNLQNGGGLDDWYEFVEKDIY